MKAGIYARVSTNGHGQTVEPQLREYVGRRGWQVAREYVDDKYEATIPSPSSRVSTQRNGTCRPTSVAMSDCVILFGLTLLCE